MRRHLVFRVVGTLCVASIVVVAAASASSSRSTARIDTVLDRLNNPRGIAIGPGGAVFVAEAGSGGTTCITKDACVGVTSAITRWAPNGRARRVIENLVSVGGRDGSFATGANGVAIDRSGAIFIAMTDAPECSTPQGMPASALATVGKLLRYTARTGVTRAADISGAECANNYDKTDRNSNPYAVAVLPSGQPIVVDAGANAVFRVDNGTVTPIAVLPKTVTGAQSVPTAIAIGPAGALYVGEFVGEPAKGKKPRRWLSRVWKLGADGAPPTVHARGFNAITGLAFAPDGTMYVTEWSVNPLDPQNANGDVVKVTPDGKRTRIGYGELHFPSGAAIGLDGSLYVSNWSILSGTPATAGPFKGKTGELMRISSP